MTQVRTSRKTYYGVIILCILTILFISVLNNRPLPETIASTPGIIVATVALYSLYKIFFGKGKIILSETEFKIYGYNWTNWDDLTAVYPFVKHDSEDGEQHYINFRLTDGTDQSVRSEHLDMTFEQIAELVSQYRTNYNRKK